MTDVVDLFAGDGRGPLWGVATDDLNATLLCWPAGEGVPVHVNDTRDVLLVVVAGDGTLTVDGEDLALRAGNAVMVEKGAARGVDAGAEGIRYVTVHLARGGLSLQRFDDSPS